MAASASTQLPRTPHWNLGRELPGPTSFCEAGVKLFLVAKPLLPRAPPAQIPVSGNQGPWATLGTTVTGTSWGPRAQKTACRATGSSWNAGSYFLLYWFLTLKT